MKKNKGITLIALIITIIVMLILVAVTVTIANDGESGLFVKARKAKVDTAYEAEKENLLMYMYGEDYNAVTGELNLASVKTKLEQDNSRWKNVNINSEGTRLEVEGIQSGKAHTVSVNGTVDGEKTPDTPDIPDTPEPEQSIYEGKVWGQYLSADKLKELGFTEDEIATREGTTTYVAKADSGLMNEGNKANNIEEAKQKLGEDIWADNTNIFTFGVKNSKFLIAGTADQEFLAQIDIKETTTTKIVMNANGVDWTVFISEDGNTLYFPMYGE